MSTDFMAVIQDFLPEVIPSQKCYMNMGPVVMELWVFEMYLDLKIINYLFVSLFIVKNITQFSLQYSMEKKIMKFSLNIQNVSFEAFMTVMFEVNVCWVVMPCSVVEGYQPFGHPCCLHLRVET
jgi:hypothetical protein